MSFGRGIALLLIFSTIGCVTVQDMEYRTAQKCRAHRAWYHREVRTHSHHGMHYARGWRSGYFDVLMGGNGACPPVPPQSYWSHRYQSERGESAIKDWFQGYRDGGAEALASCLNYYHPVQMSDEFRQCYPGCLSSDHAPYSLGRTTLGLSFPSRLPKEQSDAAEGDNDRRLKQDVLNESESRNLDIDVPADGTFPPELEIVPAPKTFSSSETSQENLDSPNAAWAKRVRNSIQQVFHRDMSLN